MIGFTLLAALLAIAAAAFVALPVWRATRRPPPAQAEAVRQRALNLAVYGDQLRELDADRAAGTLSEDDYRAARLELDRRAVEEVAADPPPPLAPAPVAASPRGGRWLAIALAIALPIAAAGTYRLLGNPLALLTPEQQFLSMLAELEAQTRRNPRDAQAWAALARGYEVFGRQKEALAAYERAVALNDRDAQLLADYAGALARAQGGLGGKPFQLVMQALKIDPSNINALALAATAAFQLKQYASSLAVWEKIAGLVPPDSRDAEAVRGAIREVRAAASAAGVVLPKAVAPPPAGGAAVAGVVELAPELKARTAPTDTLFVFARAADGPPLPLAVARAQVKDLPLRFRLDDSMSMAPDAKLSQHREVIVAARISRSGQAIPAAGDLQGASARVAVGATDIRVVIGEVVR